MTQARKSGCTLKAVAAVAAAAASIASFSGVASAVSSKVESACANDYTKFCPSYAVGSAQLRQCMRAAGNKLSPRCIEALVDSGEISRKSARRR